MQKAAGYFQDSNKNYYKIYYVNITFNFDP